MLDRRCFLTNCTAAAASVLVPAWVLASDDYIRRPSRQLFTPLIGQSFRGVDEDNVSLNFILLEIEQGPRASGLEQFTLAFKETYRITRDRFGGLFRVSHPETGDMLMRLEPSARGPRIYTSDFSLHS